MELLVKGCSLSQHIAFLLDSGTELYLFKLEEVKNLELPRTPKIKLYLSLMGLLMLNATFVEMWLVLSSGKNITSKSFGMQGVNLQKYNPLVEETLSRLKDDIAIKPSLPSTKDYTLHLSGILIMMLLKS